MSALLVIDRNRRTLRKVCSWLSPQYQVVGVPNVFTAFRLLRRRCFAGIVVRSAQYDAYAIAVLKWLEQYQRDHPVVVLLGRGTAGDAALAWRHGASEVLGGNPSRHALCRAVLESLAARPSNNGHGKRHAEATASGRPRPLFRNHHEKPWFRAGQRGLRFG
jgi:DNA-binding NtrC family response regulator